MKISNLLLISLIILMIVRSTCKAQVLAGSIPQGTSVIYPNIILKDAAPGVSAMDSIDLDCDGIKETVFELYYGMPWVDFCHAFNLLIRDTSIEICGDTGMPMNHLPFYNFGDSLCSNGGQWKANSFYHVGWGAGMCWPYTDLVIEKYIAYRKFQSIGWIKISFDMHIGIDTVTATIHEFLALCDYAGTGENISNHFFSVAPNPSVDGNLQLKSSNRTSKIVVTNIFGQVLNTLIGDHVSLILPESAGHYIIRVVDTDGNSQSEIIWRK